MIYSWAHARPLQRSLDPRSSSRWRRRRRRSYRAGRFGPPGSPARTSHRFSNVCSGVSPIYGSRYDSYKRAPLRQREQQHHDGLSQHHDGQPEQHRRPSRISASASRASHSVASTDSSTGTITSSGGGRWPTAETRVTPRAFSSATTSGSHGFKAGRYWTFRRPEPDDAPREWHPQPQQRPHRWGMARSTPTSPSTVWIAHAASR